MTSLPLDATLAKSNRPPIHIAYLWASKEVKISGCTRKVGQFLCESSIGLNAQQISILGPLHEMVETSLFHKNLITFF